MFPDMQRLLPLLPLLGLLLATGCMDETAERKEMLRAVRITSEEQLIGGPSARGKVGDYLLENDQVRFIIAGKGQTWMGGVFGGSLIDADVRRWWPEFRYGKGWDSFSETFPLVNLVVANPELPGSALGDDGEGLHLVAIPSGIEVIKDGSDGEAIVRVTGRAGYMFETMKFLNKDFLRSFLNAPLGDMLGSEGFLALLADKTIGDLLASFFEVNVHALINRLQLDFLFYNDYVLHEGERFLTLRTTIVTAPPTETALLDCPSMPDCDKECEHGFVLEESEYELEGQEAPAKAMCPICECAEPPEEMLSLNESEDIFQIMLGDLGPWKDPAWKGGLLGGDFLFFGSEANIFSPGLGFDENRKIFENMWQGVPTLANPLTFEWLAAVADNVSYGWVTINPERRDGTECTSWRYAITDLDYAQEKAVIELLVTKLGYAQDLAEARVRHVIVDGKPFPLKELTLPAGTDDLAAWQDQVVAEETLPVILDPETPDQTEEQVVSALFPEGVVLGLVPAVECRSSKVLIPIFSTSATAVMTHKSSSTMDLAKGNPLDRSQTFTFERYFVVGDGDVASVLETIYDIKGTATGRIKGAVFDDKTRMPVQHASVFALKDPRTDGTEPLPESYDELVRACVKRYGTEAFVSQMQSDLGLDPVVDGDYSGPLPPGDYVLVAFRKDRGISAPIPVTIRAGETTVAHLIIPTLGKVTYSIQDEQGKLLPGRIMFIPLDESGTPVDWEGLNHPELGGSRYDHGVYLQEHSAHGKGTVSLPPGSYEVYVSRGFEYSLAHYQDVAVQAGQTVPLDAILVREMDTTGYISGDFHVHCQPSIDSSLPIFLRVAANAAEGLEFIVGTDHDHLTNYRPYINELGLERFMQSDVGVETTSLEFGHFNGFPMEYDHTDMPVHNAPPWYGLNMKKVWDGMRERVRDGIDAKDFVVQVNHPRDGFMGYFSQLGLKGWNLQRSTPGMEMCNLQTETIPCDFDAVELMNEKRFELLRTPTIGEMDMHNDCFAELMAVTDPARFSPAADEPLCASLREPPHAECATIESSANEGVAIGLEEAALYSIRDHCRWHKEFAENIDQCGEEDAIVTCKRRGLEALKLMTVRYMMERTPAEQEAYFATTDATDLGCDMDKALLEATANLDEDGEYVKCGDGAGCACETCVCETLDHPECCLKPGGGDDGNGTGWTEACAELCLAECHGGPVRPCTSKQMVFDDWFSFLNHGFNKTAMGNSDSHDTKAEVGLPRNWIQVGTDQPELVDPAKVYRSIKEHRVLVSTGPFVEFTIGEAGLGDTLVEPTGETLPLHIRVQTASWFGVDHIEIVRNGHLEQIIRLGPKVTDIVDFDQVVELPMPDEDSWYVVIAYGLEGKYLLSPVYKRMPLGKMLIPTIIALGAQSILISFQSVLQAAEESFGGLMGEGGIDSLLAGLMGLSEMPDSFPMFPLALTNPIWVDVDGSGWKPPVFAPEDQLPDGSWPLPAFCSQPCDVVQAVDDEGNSLTDEEGNPIWGQSGCGTEQTCVPDSEGSATGTCTIPIPDNCVGSQVQ